MPVAPRHPAVDSLLVDGAVVTLRPVSAADEQALRELYLSTSADALRLRFFSASRYVVDQDIRRLVRPPDDDHVAVAAVDRGRLLGIGVWERSGPDQAEFALLVREGLHGHGVGTLLIEHLLASARDAGMHTMTADVLAENVRMLRVLRDLGMRRQTEIDSGVVHVDIPLRDSAAWRAAVGARESLAEHASLHRILSPRAIAVVGAGRRAASAGSRVVANLLQGGYVGSLYVVNHTATPVMGCPAFQRVSEIGQDVDVAVVAVPAAAVVEVVADCAAAGVYGVVVVSDGFAEAGEEGARRQARLAALVREAGMRLIGPNCLGFVNTDPVSSICALFADAQPDAGTVGLVSQSGGVGLALLDHAARRGIGVSSFVSVGNKADVSGNDLLMYWEHDAATAVCALYLESFGNARKFARVARRVARSKPVVAVTAGRSVAGARGTRSHTAAAATPAVALQALFEQAGVIHASSLSELLDVVALLAATPLPHGSRVVVVSNSGGPAALAADACAAAGLDLPPLSAELESRVRRGMVRPAGSSNPVDTTAQAEPEEIAAVCAQLLASDELDAVLLVHTSLRRGDSELVAAAVAAATVAQPAKPLVPVFLGLAAPPVVTVGDRVLPSFAFPEAAARALGAAARYARWRRTPEQPLPELSGIDRDVARRVIDRTMGDAPDGGWLETDIAFGVAAAYGIPVVPTVRVTSAAAATVAAARLGYPVAVKTAAGSIVHRSDVGAVRLDVRGTRALRACVAELRAAHGAVPLVVQSMAEPGVETAVGVVQDPTVGPMLMVALGGVATELLADRAFRLLPVTRDEARRQIASLRAAPLLTGYRGSPPCDVDALADVLLRVAALAEDVPEIVELDLNPVVVRPDGVVAVDVKIRLAPVTAPDPYLRRLSIVDRG